MKSLADRIEQYLRVLIDRSETKTLEVQRTELAETFGCVPSQITYVITTRFTPEAGYVTESRRGGRGFIKIRRVDAIPYSGKAGGVSQEEAIAVLDMLARKGILTVREARLFKSLMDKHVLGESNHEKKFLRARMLEAIVDLLEEE